MGYDWERGSADGYADAIEGALNLYNREALPSVKNWVDSQTRLMWNMQEPDGIIEGWHGDGNFTRTTIMYCLWKSQGLTADEWDENLFLGAESRNGILFVSVSCETGWSGKIKFDTPKWRDKMHLPVDYPRINQFQQWFTVEPGNNYEITYIPSGKKKKFTGRELVNGLFISLKPGEKIHFIVKGITAT